MRKMMLMLVTLLAAQLYRAAPANASDATEREIETLLLNRRIDLSGVQSYSRGQKTWQPLRATAPAVRVINLWSKTCVPCLGELPDFAKLVTDWKRRNSHDVQFLFIADPPDQSSAEAVVSFWTTPYADGLAKDCPGTPMTHGSVPSCLLVVPSEDPARSQSESLLLSVKSVEARPLTLLVDRQGTIRQVFAGSIRSKKEQLSQAIERLLQRVEPLAEPGHRRAER